jgi:hypothetical protein
MKLLAVVAVVMMIGGCMPLTPVRACEAGTASYRDSFKLEVASYGTVEATVWMQCGVVVTTRVAP